MFLQKKSLRIIYKQDLKSQKIFITFVLYSRNFIFAIFVICAFAENKTAAKKNSTIIKIWIKNVRACFDPIPWQDKNELRSVYISILQTADWSISRYSQWLEDHPSEKDRLTLIKWVQFFDFIIGYV